MEFLSQSWCDLEWMSWIRFKRANILFQDIPKVPGFYRVKPVDREILVYVGQTGRDLRERVSALCHNTLATKMPFNDPHTAASGLWAWRDSEGMEFECSVAPTNFLKKERLAFECYLLWRYRLEKGESTLCNHGRFHPHYRKSRPKSKGDRGGRLPEGKLNPNGGPSLPPLISKGKSIDSNWMGLKWSEAKNFVIEEIRNTPNSQCLYKIMNQDAKELLYIGQSQNLRNRLSYHLRENWINPTIKYSFSELSHSSFKYQLRELENDLIGSYYDQTKSAPKFQFLKYNQ
ncbi:MAG: GIY-YIG nuclease family protein [Candidatus Freyarchaeum deiterrae]